MQRGNSQPEPQGLKLCPFPQSLYLEQHFKQIIIDPPSWTEKYFLPNEPVQFKRKEKNPIDAFTWQFYTHTHETSIS